MPERQDGPFGGSGGGFADDSGDGYGASESDGGSEDGDSGGELPPAGGGSGGDDGTEPGIATPAFPVPRLECPDVPCMGPDEAFAEELQGSELARKAYFGVMGYPDQATYGSYNPDLVDPPPGAGLLGLAAKSVEVVDDLLTEAGFASCDDLPVSGEVSLGSAPDIVLGFAPGTHGFARRVHLTDASGAQALVEGTCGIQAGFVAVKLVAGDGQYDHIDVAWYASDDGNFQFELLADMARDDTRTAVRFQTQAPEYGMWLVRADDTHGERYVVHGDVSTGLASIYRHALDADPVWARDGADAFQVAPLAGSALQCADLTAKDPTTGTGSACNGLELVDPKPLAADPDGELSIEWTAIPGNGLRDALAPL